MARKVGRTSPRAIEEREKALKALEMRKSGLTYEKIAAKLGYVNESGPYRAVANLLARAEREAGTSLLELDLQRLDDMLESTWVGAKNGKLPNVDRVLRIQERRAKLLGMDSSNLNVTSSDNAEAFEKALSVGDEYVLKVLEDGLKNAPDEVKERIRRML